MRLERITIFFILFLFAITQDTNSDTNQKKKEPTLSVDPISVDPISVDPIEVQQNQQNGQSAQSLNKQQSNQPQEEAKKSGNQENIQNIDKGEINKNMNPDPRQKRQANPKMSQELQRNNKQKAQQQKPQKNKPQQETQAQKQQRQKREQIALQQAQKKNMQQIRRSAQYKAEQKRLNDLRQKRKEYEAKKKDEINMQQKVEYTRDTKENQVSETENKRIEEKKQARTIMKTLIAESSIQTIVFEINSQIQEFILRPSSEMQMFLHATVYVENNNVYGYVSDIKQTQALKAYVYEDNNKIVGQFSCFFEAAFKFKVKANSTYSIRFYNAGGPKLVSMNHPKFINSDLMNSFISSDKGKTQFNKAKTIINGLKSSMSNMQETRVMDMNNAQILGKSMQKYFGYQIIEIIAVGILCWIQIYFVKNMLKNPSIL